MQAPIRTGMAGYGMAAKVMHLPFLATSPRYEVVSVLERHDHHSQEKYPFVKVVRSMDELVADPAIDLIVITTPNETHFPYAEKALQAGKHVLVEKPFAITTEQARQLIDLSGKKGLTLAVYQNRRYTADFRTIQQILREGSLGAIAEYVAHYDRYRPGPKPNAWREEPLPGSGILYDLGAHLLDQALFLFGIPRSITADVRLQRPHARAVDYFDIWLDYGFTKVTLKAGMYILEAGPRYSIHGTRGSYVKYHDDLQEALLKEGALPGGPDWGQEPPENWGILHTLLPEGQFHRAPYPSLPGNYGLYYEQLADHLLLGSPLRELPEHSFNALRLIELAMESHAKGQTLPCNGLIELPGLFPPTER